MLKFSSYRRRGHLDKTVFSYSFRRCEQKRRQVKTVGDRKFRTCFVANSVDTTDKTRQSCFVRVGCVNCELGIRILSSMWKATEYINMLRLNVMRALDGIPCMCVVLTGYGRAFYVASVWTLMTWKWSFLLFFYTRQYRRLYEHRIGTCADVGYLHVWR